MQSIEDFIKSVILNHHLYDWFKKYPWLIGYLGNPKSSIWFIGENPSLRGIININNHVTDKSENLQWNSHAGDKLLRTAIIPMRLKSPRKLTSATGKSEIQSTGKLKLRDGCPYYNYKLTPVTQRYSLPSGVSLRKY